MPGATVRVDQRADARSSARFTTDNTGYYVAPTLPPGQVPGGGGADRLQEVRPERASRWTPRATCRWTPCSPPGGIEEAITVTGSGHAAPDQHRPGGEDDREQADPGPDAQRPQPDQPGHAQAGRARRSALNNFQPDSLTTGGFNINGSRSDENLITIDGAIATRTRSLGRDHRHRQRGHRLRDAGADRELPARVRPVLGRADPVRDQGRRPRASTATCSSSTATRAWTRTPGAATTARSPELNSQPAPFTYQPVRLRRRRAGHTSRASSTRTATSCSSSGPQEWIH